MKHTYPHILTSRTHFYSPCDAAIRAYVNSSISAVSPGDYSSAFTLRKLAEPPNASLPRALTGLFQGSLTRRALSTTCHAANLQIRGLCHVPAHETTRTRSESTGTSRQSPVLHISGAKTASSCRHTHEKSVSSGKQDANERRPITQEI
jgi:hypothetical protein